MNNKDPTEDKKQETRSRDAQNQSFVHATSVTSIQGPLILSPVVISW